MPGARADLGSVTTLLCDADGTLFDSEEPAFDVAVVAANRCLELFGAPQRYTADGLRRAANGLSFRATITGLARDAGVDVDGAAFRSDVERWVLEENEAVTRHLSAVLQPDPAVVDPLRRLAEPFGLAVVTSSALTRIDASLTSSGIADLFPSARRFSAQDSLPVPTTKPHPAVYTLALERLGLRPRSALALEDAVPGVRSAVAAGVVTVGMLCFVPPAERAQRVVDLERAGASVLVDSWSELEQLLDPQPRPARTDLPPNPDPTPRRAS